jgi:hypothetical protein
MISKNLGVFAAIVFLWMPPLESRGQTPSPAGHTITVTGIGNASGPVSGAVVMAVVRGPVDTPGLEAALRQAGVAEFVDDHSPVTLFNASATGVRGRLRGATREDVDAATRTVTAYTNAHRGASVVTIRFFGPATDCSSIAPKAREAALTDAQTRAREIAGNMGVQLGAVVSVTERGACPPPGRLGGSYAIDAQTLQMTVPVQESVTYAVSP